jgi:hypothetical protein
MGACRPTKGSNRPNIRREIYPPGRRERRERRLLLVSWPEALRAVRRWLEPWLMLWRYWRAFCDLPPPTELRALLEMVYSGRELYLYVR